MRARLPAVSLTIPAKLRHATPLLGRRPVDAEGVRESAMSKRCRAKRRPASRVDMPQRAVLESALPLVLGAALTRVPAAAFPRMQMRVPG